MDEERITKAFEGTSFKPESKLIIHNNRTLHYMAIGDTSKPTVLFVHGSPGSWDNFIGFMKNKEMLESFRMISVDRPGFGKSEPGKPERSLPKQAELVAQALYKEQSGKPTIIAGHSFGGPVIARMAIDYPELVSGLIFVAASIDPELEETKWFQIPVHYKILSWILPNTIYATNEEILALEDELEDMKPLWGQITQPVSIIQGTKDNLVPYENALFGKEMLINSKPEMVIKDMNHFVPWEYPHLIRKEIFRIQNVVSNNESVQND